MHKLFFFYVKINLTFSGFFKADVVVSSINSPNSKSKKKQRLNSSVLARKSIILNYVEGKSITLFSRPNSSKKTISDSK